MKKTCLLMACLVAAGTVAAVADMDADLRAVQSRALSMSKGYYSDAEWNDLTQTLDRLTLQADEQGLVAEYLDLVLLKATVLGGLEPRRADARALLETAVKKHGQRPLPQVQRVYTHLAEVYAREGDQAAVDALLAAYRESPAYEEDTYEVSGGTAPGDPIKIVRPASPGQGSTTVTAMQGQRSQSALTPGASFPDIRGDTLSGASVGLDDYRGRVVLVDCWVRGWHLWERQLPQRVELHRRFRESGFEILGVCMNPDTEDLGAYMKSRDITWPNIVKAPHIMKQLGLHGESTSFLLDRNGVILGRDLAGADLLEAVKSAL
jgi:hypothetical protein